MVKAILFILALQMTCYAMFFPIASYSDETGVLLGFFSQQNIFGLNIDYVTKDSSGDIYDYFSGNLVPSTPLGKRESYGFKLNNDFYGKIFTNGDYKKIHLINWSNSLSYNPTYEEFKLSLW